MMFSKCFGSKSSNMLSFQINIAGLIHLERRSIESISSWKKVEFQFAMLGLWASFFLSTWNIPEWPASSFSKFHIHSYPNPNARFISVYFREVSTPILKPSIKMLGKTNGQFENDHNGVFEKNHLLMPFGLEVFQAPKMAKKRLRFRIEGKLARKLSYLNSLLGLITASL